MYVCLYGADVQSSSCLTLSENAMSSESPLDSHLLVSQVFWLDICCVGIATQSAWSSHSAFPNA